MGSGAPLEMRFREAFPEYEDLPAGWWGFQQSSPRPFRRALALPPAGQPKAPRSGTVDRDKRPGGNPAGRTQRRRDRTRRKGEAAAAVAAIRHRQTRLSHQRFSWHQRPLSCAMLSTEGDCDAGREWFASCVGGPKHIAAGNGQLLGVRWLRQGAPLYAVGASNEDALLHSKKSWLFVEQALAEAHYHHPLCFRVKRNVLLVDLSDGHTKDTLLSRSPADGYLVELLQVAFPFTFPTTGSNSRSTALDEVLFRLLCTIMSRISDFTCAFAGFVLPEMLADSDRSTMLWPDAHGVVRGPVDPAPRRLTTCNRPVRRRTDTVAPPASTHDPPLHPARDRRRRLYADPASILQPSPPCDRATCPPTKRQPPVTDDSSDEED